MHTSQRGSILVFSLLTMAVMLVIGLSLNALFIRKLKRISAVRDSTVAIYAADSGVEMCLNEARSSQSLHPFGAHDDLITGGGGPTPLPGVNGAQILIMGSGGSIVTETDITGDCHGLGSASFDFRVTGTFNGVQRTLEISQ